MILNGNKCTLKLSNSYHGAINSSIHGWVELSTKLLKFAVVKIVVKSVESGVPLLLSLGLSPPACASGFAFAFA